MKQICEIMAIACIALSTASAQSNLELDFAAKFDVKSARMANYADNDVILYMLNYLGDLTTYGVDHIATNAVSSAIFFVADGDFEYVAGLTSSYDVEVLDVLEDPGLISGKILMTGRDSITWSLIDTTIDFVFPDDDHISPILNFFFGNGEPWTSSYIKAKENTIQKVSKLGFDYVFTGSFTDSLSYANPDGSIIALDSVGNYGYAIAVDPRGYYKWSYLSEGAGFNFTRATIARDEVLTIYQDILSGTVVLQLSSDGALLDRHELPGISVYSAERNDDGIYAISGHYDAQAVGTDMDFGVGSLFLPEPTSLDAFLIVYDDNDNALWSQTIGGGNIDTGTDLAFDETGIYLTGCIQEDGIFDPQGEQIATLIASGLEDAFFAKYDLDGNLSWVEQFGGTSNDIGLNVVVDRDDENIILEGVFREEMDINPDPEEETILEAELDTYDFSRFYAVFSLDPFLSVESISGGEVHVFPNPTSGQITVDNTNTKITKVYSILGRQLWTGMSNTVDLSSYQKGHYIIELDVDGKKVRQMIEVIRQ